MKKINLLVILLALAIILFGCDNGASTQEIIDNTPPEPTDTWTNATNNSIFEGSWQGSLSETMTKKELYEAWNLEWTPLLETFYGDMVRTRTYEIFSTVNSGIRRALRMTDTYVFSGGNIENAWPQIKNNYLPWLGSGWTANDSTYSITNSFRFTAPQDGPGGPIPANYFVGLEVNQDSTKIRRQSLAEGFFTHDYFIFTRP